MPIYTKTGDKGQTSIFGGGRVSKAHPQVHTYGVIDELTSVMGLVIAKMPQNAHNELLTGIQRDLYTMMGILAGAKGQTTSFEAKIATFEHEIDVLDKELPKLTRFILPGGTELAGWLHILRTTCRRAEREAVAFFNQEEKETKFDEETERIMLKYLNRLSDLLFMLARKYAEGKETLT